MSDEIDQQQEIEYRDEINRQKALDALMEFEKGAAKPIHYQKKEAIIW